MNKLVLLFTVLALANLAASTGSDNLLQFFDGLYGGAFPGKSENTLLKCFTEPSQEASYFRVIKFSYEFASAFSTNSFKNINGIKNAYTKNIKALKDTFSCLEKIKSYKSYLKKYYNVTSIQTLLNYERNYAMNYPGPYKTQMKEITTAIGDLNYHYAGILQGQLLQNITKTIKEAGPNTIKLSALLITAVKTTMLNGQFNFSNCMTESLATNHLNLIRDLSHVGMVNKKARGFKNGVTKFLKNNEKQIAKVTPMLQCIDGTPMGIKYKHRVGIKLAGGLFSPKFIGAVKEIPVNFIAIAQKVFQGLKNKNPLLAGASYGYMLQTAA